MYINIALKALIFSNPTGNAIMGVFDGDGDHVSPKLSGPDFCRAQKPEKQGRIPGTRCA